MKLNTNEKQAFEGQVQQAQQAHIDLQLVGKHIKAGHKFGVSTYYAPRWLVKDLTFKEALQTLSTIKAPPVEYVALAVNIKGKAAGISLL